MLDGLQGEETIAKLCRFEGVTQGIYYKWSKDFLEAGKKRLADGTAWFVSTGGIKDLRREASELEEALSKQALELQLLQKSGHE